MFQLYLKIFKFSRFNKPKIKLIGNNRLPIVYVIMYIIIYRKRIVNKGGANLLVSMN